MPAEELVPDDKLAVSPFPMQPAVQKRYALAPTRCLLLNHGCSAWARCFWHPTSGCPCLPGRPPDPRSGANRQALPTPKARAPSKPPTGWAYRAASHVSERERRARRRGCELTPHRSGHCAEHWSRSLAGRIVLARLHHRPRGESRHCASPGVALGFGAWASLDRSCPCFNTMGLRKPMTSRAAPFPLRSGPHPTRNEADG